MFSSSFLQKFGLKLAAWSEKWFPDALVFAFFGIVFIFCVGLIMGETPSHLIVEGGKSFWALIPFTLQMIMVILGGYVVATAPAVHHFIDKLSHSISHPKRAVTFIALFSMLSSLISWGLSLILSALLVKHFARKIKTLDYRAAAASAYLGLGAIWALGLSSSAALMMSSSESIPKKLLEISGVIPLKSTLFLWQNGVLILVLIITSLLIAYYSYPNEKDAKTAADFGIDLSYTPALIEKSSSITPAEKIENSCIPNLVIAAFLSFYLFHLFRHSSQGILAALDLNTYNLIFITLGLILQKTPKRFVKAISEATPSCSGVLIQFPFYAVIFGMISGTGISEKLSHLFTQMSTHNTYSLLVALYSATLGVFIPSGGSKWIIEAPYVLEAAKTHGVHLGWVVQIYNAAEALPNLINPFWMLPLLGILKIKVKDVVGYTMLQLCWHIPLVFFLCWALS